MIKRILLLLSICLLFLPGCSEKQELKQPVSFYYLNQTITYHTADGLISAEQREGQNKDLTALLTEYLQGPQGQSFTDPFPKGTTLKAAEMQGNVLKLTLSDRYAELTGLSLSLANACLARTVFAISDAETLVITCSTKQLCGEAEITINRDSILLLDEHVTSPAGEASQPIG